MSDKINVEIQEKDITLSADVSKDLTKFKNELELKAKEIKDQKTLTEAEKFLGDAQISVDYKDLALQVGGVILKADTREQLDQRISQIETDLKSINTELNTYELEMRRQQQQVIDNAKKDENKLSDQVNDNTSTNIDMSKEIKEKSWLGTLLTGSTTLEQAISDKESVELEAFRKSLLEALKKGQTEYEKVLKSGGAATFNKKEWYTLQFIELNKVLLSKKESKIDWKKLKADYNKGLDANGNPIETNVPISKDNIAPQSPGQQKSIDQMTYDEKVLKAQEAMQSLQGLQMVTEKDQYTGKTVNYVDLSTIQYEAVQTLNQLGGADFGYDAIKYKKSKLDKRNDKLVEGAQSKMNKAKNSRQLEKAQNTFADVNDEFTKQRKALQQMNGFSQNIANERNYGAYNMNVANNGMNLAKGPGYAGVTMDVIPYTPLFTNICQNIHALTDRGHITMDVIGIGSVQVRAPERYNLAFQNSMNGVAGQYGLDGNYALNGTTAGTGGMNAVDNLLTKYTRMTPDQAKGLTNGLLLGGGAFLLFKSVRWLFTGKWKSDKPLLDTFWGRAAAIGGGLWGLNKLSQMGTGHNVTDVLKGLYTGQMTFSDLWKGTYAKYPTSSLEYSTGTVQTYNQAFRNIPYSMIVPSTEKGADGYPKVTNIDAILLQMKTLEGQTTDWNQKANLRSQIDFLEQLKKDPNGQSILNDAFVNMGITYDNLHDKKNENVNANEITDNIYKRTIALQEFQKKNALILRTDDVSKKNRNDYLQTGVPSLDKMKADGCFEIDPNAHTDIQDGVELPDEKLDVALRGVDKKIASKIQLAKDQWLSTVEFKNGEDAPTLELSTDSKLLLKSYGLMTPIEYKVDANGKDIFHAGTLGIDFPDAKSALAVANLTNRLINLYSGKSTDTKPFGVAMSDIKFGDQKFLWGIRSTSVVDGDDRKNRPWNSSTINQIGGETFENKKADYTAWLNELYNVNGKSIWIDGGKVTDTKDINRYFNVESIKKVDKAADNQPALKDEEEKKPDNTKGPQDAIADKEPEKVNIIVDSEKINTTAISFKKQFDGKDGGSESDQTAKYMMPDSFFKAWATAYLQYGKGAGPETFTYNYVDATGKKKALLYKRLIGTFAPVRVSEVEGKR